MAAAGEQTITTILNNPDNDTISLYVGKPLILRTMVGEATLTP